MSEADVLQEPLVQTWTISDHDVINTNDFRDGSVSKLQFDLASAEPQFVRVCHLQ